MWLIWRGDFSLGDKISGKWFVMTLDVYVTFMFKSMWDDCYKRVMTELATQLANHPADHPPMHPRNHMYPPTNPPTHPPTYKQK